MIEPVSVNVLLLGSLIAVTTGALYISLSILKKSREFRTKLFDQLNTLRKNQERQKEQQAASFTTVEKKIERQTAELKIKHSESITNLDKTRTHFDLSHRHQSHQLKQLGTDVSQLKKTIAANNDACIVKTNLPSIRKRISSDDSSVTILIAGMRHSGSTAIYNLVRFILEQYNIDYEAGYSEYHLYEKIDIRSSKVRVIKTHELRDDIQEAADFIITTRRDLRDTVASAVRRDFKMLKQLGGAVNYAKYNRALHELWAGKTDYEVVYEKLKSNEASTIATLCEILGFNDANIKSLAALINDIPNDNYAETLFTDSHVTDKSGRLTYSDTLKKEDITLIDQQSFYWLTQNGYSRMNS